MFGEIFGAWIAAFLTLAIFSFLYKDNPFYKIAEHIFVGVSAGYWMSMFFWTQIQPNLFGRLWPATHYSDGFWYGIYNFLGIISKTSFQIFKFFMFFLIIAIASSVLQTGN